VLRKGKIDPILPEKGGRKRFPARKGAQQLIPLVSLRLNSKRKRIDSNVVRWKEDRSSKNGDRQGRKRSEKRRQVWTSASKGGERRTQRSKRDEGGSGKKISVLRKRRKKEAENWENIRAPEKARLNRKRQCLVGNSRLFFTSKKKRQTNDWPTKRFSVKREKWGENRQRLDHGKG